MCLTIPKQVIATNGSSVSVKLDRGKERVLTLIKVKKGDWVLAQNNCIIKKISQKQAEEINKLILTS